MNKFGLVTQDNVHEFIRDVVNVHYRKEHNTKIFTRTITPNRFLNDFEKTEFYEQEIQRCKKGCDLYRHTGGKKGMCGKQYFYFNYCKLDGKKWVEYRTCDNEWFKLINEVTLNHQGIVCVKRRQSGWSSKEMADIIHDMLFVENSMIGLDSKTEKDSFDFFRKMLLMFDALPTWLKMWDRITKTKDVLILGEKSINSKGEEEVSQFSMAYAVAPVDTAHEGRSITKLVDDEAGKKQNLLQKWSYTVDGIYQGTDQYQGVPLIFGTSGEIGTTGGGLMEMWYNHDKYNLVQHFVGAWTGFKVDKYGNDNIEAAIYNALKLRDKLKGKDWIDQVQKQPFTPEEAFSQFGDNVPWDGVKVNKQLIKVTAEQIEGMAGELQLMNGKYEFIPKQNGKIIIYELPQPSRIYMAGGDPADHDFKDVRQKKDKLSKLSTVIAKKINGLEGNNIVCKYRDRPSNLDEYFLTCSQLLTFYNEAKILIEDNRARMLTYFEKNMMFHLLKNQPTPINKMMKNPVLKYGFKRTEPVYEHQKQLMVNYINDYVDTILDKELLQQLLDYGNENCDDVDALMALLLYMEDEYVNLPRNTEETKKFSTGFKYKKVNGVIRAVQVNY